MTVIEAATTVLKRHNISYANRIANEIVAEMQPKHTLPEDIICDIVLQILPEYTGETVMKSALKKRTRLSEIVLSRYVIMYFIRNRLKWNLVTIGRWFTIDHSTVINGLTRIDDLLFYDKAFKAVINKIESQLNNI